MGLTEDFKKVDKSKDKINAVVEELKTDSKTLIETAEKTGEINISLKEYDFGAALHSLIIPGNPKLNK